MEIRPGWTVRVSNPGRARDFYLVHNSSSALEPTQFRIQLVPDSLPGLKWPGYDVDRHLYLMTT